MPLKRPAAGGESCGQDSFLCFGMQGPVSGLCEKTDRVAGGKGALWKRDFISLKTI